MTLVEFLRVRLGEDRHWPDFLRTLASLLPEGQALRDLADRLERDLEAKRRIMDLYLPPDSEPHPGQPCTNDAEADPDGEHYTPYDSCDRHLHAAARHRAEGRFSSEAVLRLLVLPYADHPDYDASWKP